MATNLYWINDAGDYNDPSHWSYSSGGTACGCIPTTNDNVYFDANSFLTINQAINISAESYAKDFSWAGVTNSPRLSGSANLTISGNVTLSSTVTYQYSGIIYLESNQLGNTIQSNGAVLNGILACNNTSGEWILQDALNSTRELVLFKGTLNTNSKSVKCLSFWSNNSELRGLVLGNSTVEILGGITYYFPYNSTSPWEIGATNFNLVSGTSRIVFSGPNLGVQLGSNLIYHDLVFNNTQPGANATINSAGTINHLDCSVNFSISGNNNIKKLTSLKAGTIAGDNVIRNAQLGDAANTGDYTLYGFNTFDTLTLIGNRKFSFDGNNTQIINHLFQVAGTCTQPCYVENVYSGQANIQVPSSGTVSISNAFIKDINASGGASFIASNSVDISNNTGITFTAPASKTIYWVGNAGNWDDAAHWSATSGGSGGYCLPTLYDDVVFDASSFTDSLQTVNINYPKPAYCRNFTCTDGSKKPKLNLQEVLNVYGSFSIQPNFNIDNGSAYSPYSIEMEGATSGKTISMNGANLNANLSFNAEGEWTFADDFSSSRFIFHGKGSLVFGSHTHSFGAYLSDNTNVRSLNLTNSIIHITWNHYYSGYAFWSVNPAGMSLTGGASSKIFSDDAPGVATNFNGGGFTYGNIYSTQLSSNPQINNAVADSIILIASGGTNNTTANYVSTALDFQGQNNSIIQRVSCGRNAGLSNCNITHMDVANNMTMTSNPLLHYMSIGGDASFAGNNTFDTLILSAGKYAYINNYTTTEKQRVNNLLQAIGTCNQAIAFKNQYAVNQVTLEMPASAIAQLDYVSFENILATGGASFVANNSIDIANNTGITFAAPTSKTIYWVGNAGNWDDAAHWSATSGGSGGYCLPTLYDDVVFDANSFTDSLQTININYYKPAYCRNFTCTDGSKKPKINLQDILNVHGSLSLQANFSIDNGYAYSPYSIEMEGATSGKTITMNGASLNANLSFRAEGEWTFTDDFRTPRFIQHEKGSVIFGSNNHYFGAYLSDNTNVRSLDLTNSVIHITWNHYYSGYAFWSVNPSGMSLTGGASSKIICDDNPGVPTYFNGGGFTYGRIYSTQLSSNPQINNAVADSIICIGSGGTNNTTANYVSTDLDFQGQNNSTLQRVSCGRNATLTSCNITHIDVANNASMSSNPLLHYMSIGGDGSFTGNNTFDTLILSAGKYAYINNYTTTEKQRVNNLLQAIGTCNQAIAFKNQYSVNQVTLEMPASAVAQLDYVSFENILATGGASFVANNSIDIANNTGITFTAPASKTIYWVGNAGNWDDAAHWSATSGGSGGYCLPTLYDDVVFDENSFTDSLQIVNVNYYKPAYCRNFTCTDGSKKPKLNLQEVLNVYGSLSLQANFNIDNGYAYSASNVEMEGADSGKTITMNGASLNANLSFRAEGEWTFTDDFRTPRFIQHEKGSVIFGSNNHYFGAYLSDNTNVRSMELSNSVIHITWNHYYSGYAFWMLNPAGMSLTGGASSRIIYEEEPGVPTAFHGGGFTYGTIYASKQLNSNPQIYNANADSIIFNGNGAIYGNNSIQTLQFKGHGVINGNNTIDTLLFVPLKNYSFAGGSTTTITNYWENTGDCNNFTQTTGSGTAYLIAGNPLTISNNNLSNLHVTSGTITALNCNDIINNQNFVLTAPSARILYWVNGTGNWSESSHWSLSSGGAGGACIPSSNDDVIFDQNSFPVLGASVGINQEAFCKTMDWTQVTNQPLLSGNSNLNVYGSLLLDPDMQFNFTNTIYFKSPAAGNTINLAGISLANQLVFSDNNQAGEWILANELKTSGSITFEGGNLNTNNQKLTCLVFNTVDNSISKSLSLTNSELNITGDNANWNLNVSNIVIIPGSSSINFTGNGSISFSSTSLAYNNVNFKNTSSAIALNGYNNFNVLSSYAPIVINDYPFNNYAKRLNLYSNATILGNQTFDTVYLAEERSYTFGANDTLFCKTLLARGQSGLNITIQSTSSGTQTHFSVENEVCSNFLNLKDCAIFGPAVYNAGDESTDNGNNINWAFTSCFEALLTKKDISCFGMNDGEVYLEIDGGTSPYTISWDGIVSADLSKTNLSPGTYTVEITDAMLNVAADTITILEPAVLNISTSIVHPDCNLANGSVSASISGGKSPYSYSWDNGATSLSLVNLNAGTFEITVTDLNNCSAVKAETLINQNDSYTVNNPQVICQGQSYSINGNTYTEAGSYTDVLQSIHGCDSTIITALTVNPATSGTDVQTACGNFTWIDGMTYTSSTNTPTFTLTNALGCDSTVTLDLTINYSSTGTDVQTACGSFTWIDGLTYTSSTNTPTFTLTNAAGCDSIVTLDLTINSTSSGTDVQAACGSFTWIDGITYTSSTSTPTFIFTNSFGCDSIVTLDLTINNANTGTDVQAACGSFTWIDGITYTSTTNTPAFTLTNAFGCDSIVTLDLTINNANTGTDVQTACGSFTWIDGITYTSSTNTPTFTLTNTFGCDSLVTLDLTINSTTTGTDVQAACGSFTWIDGITYTSSTNTPTFTLTSGIGCDSTVTLNLTINNANTGTDIQTACGSFTWIDGITYTSSTNTPTFTLTNAFGCDSIVTLDLTINNASSGTDVQTACGSFTWMDGITYTSSTNAPTFTLTNTIGCDSIVSLNLTIKNTSTGTDVQTACESFTWIDGITYTSSTNAPTFTLTNAIGCDSIVTLDLTINNANTGTDVQTACGSFTWIDGINYTSSTSTPVFTLTNAFGCDSIVTLDLTILNPVLDNTVTLNAATVTANETNASYQWIDCNGNTVITGETAQSFTPLLNGEYAVILTSLQCGSVQDTSACITIDNAGLSDLNVIETIALYPNPANAAFWIESQGEPIQKITVFNADGKLIFVKELNAKSAHIESLSWSEGMYWIEVKTESQLKQFKLIKQ